MKVEFRLNSDRNLGKARQTSDKNRQNLIVVDKLQYSWNMKSRSDPVCVKTVGIVAVQFH